MPCMLVAKRKEQGYTLFFEEYINLLKEELNRVLLKTNELKQEHYDKLKQKNGRTHDRDIS